MINKWKRGETITARRLNETVDAFNRSERAGFDSRMGIGGKKAVTVVEVFDDYLKCRPLNQTEATADLFVAKPWDLRKSPRDGVSYADEDGELYTEAWTAGETQVRTVTKTSDSSTEDQVTTPQYVPRQTISGTVYVGSQLTIERMPVEERFNITDSATGYTIQLEWVDCNRAGRAWAKAQ